MRSDGIYDFSIVFIPEDNAPLREFNLEMENHRCIRQCNMQNRKLKDIKCDRHFVNEISLFVKEYVSWLMIAIFSISSEKKKN